MVALRPRRYALTTLLAGVLLLVGCAGTTPIRQLLDDPSHHDGQNVRISGHVTETIGIAGLGAYRVDDGSGTIMVVSKEGGAPRKDTSVAVEGKFHAAFTLGPQTLAVVVESHRTTR
jgi:hypothetical protein